MTNLEILEIALQQSAYDCNCAAADFLSEENVVTHADHRGKGYATAFLNYAKELAVTADCYKMMLLTGAKNESTLNFYKRAGYNCTDKTAFIQWL